MKILNLDCCGFYVSTYLIGIPQKITASLTPYFLWKFNNKEFPEVKLNYLKIRLK